MELPIQYWSEKVGKTVPRDLELVWNITAAKTVNPAIPGLPVYTSFDAIASQAVIDGFLGTTNEFLVAAFDATAMGTDAFAGIVNLGNDHGQAANLVFVDAKVISGTAGATQTPYSFVSVSALTASSLSSQCALGASGNVAFRLVSTGLDALTSGMIVVKLKWVSK